jgi:S-adenosyl-L-methionine hydrolase (adenosine-forming)
MILLFTDFGLSGPYLGQVRAVLAAAAPAVPVIDLFADAPSRDPRAAAYLLAAYGPWFAPGSVLFCVVDPGVGGSRAALAIEADGRWYVGPDNGLFEIILRRAVSAQVWEIAWRPEQLSASFHGRDLFAPVAARLALGESPPGAPRALDHGRHPGWPDDLPEIVYVDQYGNAMTGLRASQLPADATLLVASGRRIARARTFGDVPPRAALWYENANGLAEIAVNLGRADQALGLTIGGAVGIEPA